jgi:hypothetical protein
MSDEQALPNTPDVTPERLQTCLTLLKTHGIKIVAFDMDFTAVAEHSRGKLARSDLESYLSRATSAFQQLVPLLHENKFGLAIATHSDEAEFGGPIQPETHILGKELATALVERHFDSSISSSFFIVAYNPRVHPEDTVEENKIKRFHIRKLREQFGVDAEEIIFFDDTLAVVADCSETLGVRAIHVNPVTGFCIEDMIFYLGQLPTKTDDKK